MYKILSSPPKKKCWGIVAGAICILASLYSPVLASPFFYTREATPNTVTVGDIVDIRLTVIHRENIQVTPDAISWPEAFVIHNEQQTKTVSGNLITETWLYKVAVFETGKQQIPESALQQSLPDGNMSAYKLPAITLNVVSSLPPNTSVIGALKPLLAPSLTLWPWLLGIACLGLALWFLWKQKKNSRNPIAPEAPPLLSPKEEALLAIESLTTSGIIDREDYKSACLAMTDILKRFLSRHYHQKMQEMTSEEVTSALRQTTVKTPVLTKIRSLLRHCDHIKFANSRSSAEDCYGLLKTLRDTVSEIADTEKETSETEDGTNRP